MPVNSGFALSPCSAEAREVILKAGNEFFFPGAKLETATNWVPFLIPTVPSFIRKEQGQVGVSSSMLSNDIERVCSMQPAYVKLYGQNKSDAPHRTWMALFSKAPHCGYRVFDESGIARPFKKQQPLNSVSVAMEITLLRTVQELHHVADLIAQIAVNA
ncbi:putative eka-like protein [Erysiphe necator]|uniref:Putative eka-like protein n=1 Tax=Uncinula necator TaxID=52586 RepID=A0A0B1NXE1_UNCNE|nr:putative eka-like protein [Erysiphe necator]